MPLTATVGVAFCYNGFFVPFLGEKEAYDGKRSIERIELCRADH